MLELVFAEDLANARVEPEPFEKGKMLLAMVNARIPTHKIFRESFAGVIDKFPYTDNFCPIFYR